MAGLVAAEVVPVLVLGPVAGVLIDRFSRKAILIGADLVRPALVLTLLRPQSAGAWHAYLVAAGLAAGRLVQILASAVAGGLIALIGAGPLFPRTPPASSARHC